ncbi:MAG: terminase small subunit [Paludibacteraceae bacterium]|nr:terminase small subunit [Paludibacteraceae bacterium]
MALNERQKAFADYYIQTGNATEAAIKAGYSEKTARSIGAENLTKPDISAYIRERLDEQSEKRVADANEVIEFYTAVMRGEVKDQFGLDASLSDRLKAGDALMKRYAVTDNGSKGVLEKLDDVLSKIGGNI